ncbi:MAG: hypothetical protein QXM16_01885 [Nitrososphaerota archaeon]
MKNEEDGTISIHAQGEEGVLEAFVEKIKTLRHPQWGER